MAAKTPYPKTMVVVITAHGKIPVIINTDGSQEPVFLSMPPDMTLTQINAVAPGICNFTDPNFAANILTKVKEISNPVLINPQLSAADIQNLSDELAAKVKEFTKADSKNRDKIMEKDEKATTYLQDYNYHYNKICTKTFHSKCKPAINKIYSTSQISSSYDDTIMFLNTPDGDMDYFLEMDQPLPNKSYRITLESILWQLKERGVENIILIDLSCSVFSELNLTERDIRDLRRNIRKDSLLGGRMHWRTKWNKTKRTKCNKTKRTKRKRKF